jgi:hypothetical protein
MGTVLKERTDAEEETVRLQGRVEYDSITALAPHGALLARSFPICHGADLSPRKQLRLRQLGSVPNPSPEQRTTPARGDDAGWRCANLSLCVGLTSRHLGPSSHPPDLRGRHRSGASKPASGRWRLRHNTVRRARTE